MTISVFDLFTIGIGPSSSHTVGPMRAASQFVQSLRRLALLEHTCTIKVELFGSLGATGKAHGSDKAVLLGLLGETPESVDPDSVPDHLRSIRASGRLSILDLHEIRFREDEHLIFNKRDRLPYHPNGMRFEAGDNNGNPLHSAVYYSVGGGFVIDERTAAGNKGNRTIDSGVPHRFGTAEELLRLCAENEIPISQLMLENEKAQRNEEEIVAELLNIWTVMRHSIERGCRSQGILPGSLRVRRRAAILFEQLDARPEMNLYDPLTIMDWVNVYALAVSEENAAGGRVVTAPTNGAAGIVPAVLNYYVRFVPGADETGIVRFLLTAAAIGILFKMNASISGAEVGCQGEVGSACSMAAGALCEVMGGTPAQVENAAEIALEHNLGLTCDPVQGFVQIPCIERNAIASVKAINAARIALLGDGNHVVSLDNVIKTMRDTGADMKNEYKETARGGLAVNVIGIPVNMVDC